ncbi:MAG: DnaJ domain-containing protein [Pelomonas sp.]|nr:DnaJ domain-containing protein [Roseateles sp.]
MNLVEIATIVGGAGAGYWLVSFLLGGRKQVPTPTADTAVSPPPAAVPTWPAVLGVAADASVEEIRAAYQRLVSQYHPDKVASLGTELQEFASRKTQAINAAYAEALAARGAAP